jgi:subtilisin-like proprotein convertase family protein
VNTVALNPGDRYGMMLTPNGTVRELLNHPDAATTLRPLFSLATANPLDQFHVGQIADVTGRGQTFAWEDLRSDGWTDRDYNDVIVNITGASGRADALDDWIDPSLDWRETPEGQKLITYITAPERQGITLDRLPDAVAAAIYRSADLDAYPADRLAQTREWVVNVIPGGQSAMQLAALIGAQNLGLTSHIPNTYLWRFPVGANPEEISNRLRSLNGIEFSYPLVPLDLVPSHIPSDPMFGQQWNLSEAQLPQAWDVVAGNPAQPLRGDGVVVGVIDTGLQHTHPDLVDRYRSDLSRNFNVAIGETYGNDPAPIVGSGMDQQVAAHGTAVAGIIAASSNNQGISGVAPEAQIAGLRLISRVSETQVGDITDLQVADALSYLNQDIDIYNSSWNPRDPLQGAAMSLYELYTGATQGRNGLGNVYVFSAGNGQQRRETNEPAEASYDNVNYDGFANSRYVLPVAALDRTGKQTSYSESGAPLIVSAFADGVTTTDLVGGHGAGLGDYQSNFSGTSAAAPVVSGVVALMLDANPTLSWRDVEDILIRTAMQNDPTDADWQVNGAGLRVNHKYGFGAVNAAEAVQMAIDRARQPLGSELLVSSGWQTLAPVVGQLPDTVHRGQPGGVQPIPDYAMLRDAITFTGLTGKVSDVEVKLWASHDRYADLDVWLVSPSGRRVQLFSDLDDDSTQVTLGDRYLKPIADAANINGGGVFRPAESIAVFDDDDPNDKWFLEVQDDQAGVSGVLNSWSLDLSTAVEQSVTITDDITVEKVEVVLDVTHPNRGDLEVVLISPDGTESVLAQEHDDEGNDYTRWVFTSARNWGESAKGEWKLRVSDLATENTGTWNAWKLNVYGARPTVSIQATDPDATEGGDAGEFTLTRTGNPKFPLTVNYQLLGGTSWSSPQAINGSDYQQLPATITFPAGASSVKVPIVSKEDSEVEWTETVRMQLTNGDGYETSSVNLDTVKIWDNELSDIRVYAEHDPYIHMANYVTESGNPGRFLFRRLGSVKDPLTVTYTMTGTATSGVDYQALPSNFTFAAGEHDVDTPENFFQAIDDNEVEGNETAILTINPSPNYTILTDWGSRVSTIWDDEVTPSVSITTRGNVAEGEKGQFVFTRTGNLTGDLTVDYWDINWWQRARGGIDYQLPPNSSSSGDPPYNDRLSGSVTIPDGVASVTLDFQTLEDSLNEGNERIHLKIKESPNYIFGTTDRADLWILDDDFPQRGWIGQFGTAGQDDSTSIATDASGNLYLTGRTSGNLADSNQGTYDAWIAKRDANGEEIWKRQFGTVGYDAATAVAVGASGNVYLTGWTDGVLGDGSNTGRDAWIAKYDSNGELLWKRQLGAAANSSSAGYDLSKGAVAVGSDDSIYLTGFTYGSLNGTNQGEADAWVAKYNSDGTEAWVRQLGTAAWDEAHAIALDSSGSVYLTGRTRGNLEGSNAGDSDAWVAKYTSTGTLTWTHQLGTDTEDSANGISVTPDGKVYIGGHTRSKLGDTFLSGDLANGDIYEWRESAPVWNAIHGDWSSVGGTYYGNADAWVAQLNSDSGNLNWKRQLGTTEYDTATGVTSDSTGNVYLTGYTNGSLGGTSAGREDAWVAQYNANGALQWRTQVGTAAEDLANGISVRDGKIYLTGVTSGNLEGINAGGQDAWVMQLS